MKPTEAQLGMLRRMGLVEGGEGAARARASLLPIKLKCACGALFDSYLRIEPKVEWLGEQILNAGGVPVCGDEKRHARPQ